MLSTSCHVTHYIECVKEVLCVMRIEREWDDLILHSYHVKIKVKSWSSMILPMKHKLMHSNKMYSTFHVQLQKEYQRHP